ncbi:MAG: hypothetical protein F4Y84_02815 [Caldilineaceae bacterium SB0665_bin_25]|nr:hypothetical protein [Caldilineaceae bacterium SB0665_bin_25]
MDAPVPSWQSLYTDETRSWIWPPAYEPNSNPRELDQAGFREASAYRNYAGDALTRDSAGMVFLAQK